MKKEIRYYKRTRMVCCIYFCISKSTFIRQVYTFNHLLEILIVVITLINFFLAVPVSVYASLTTPSCYISQGKKGF